MRRSLLTILGLVVIVGLLGIGGVLLGPRALAAIYRVPTNPVTFPHTLHVTTLGLECQFCHRTPDISPAATVPGLELCMFCHKVAGLANPRAQIVRAAWESGQPLNWVRQHRLPDHTRFKHEPHITAGVACATCHGDVGAVAQVTQVRPLKMGDCVACHKNPTQDPALGEIRIPTAPGEAPRSAAPTQCAVCHY
ncbi:MAG: cytochrome c3 family protein [Chloroflexi bacterium]|nr:cytochrome c3 family protein [Chloroflexota bacterium]